jgi:hypothetical protein
MIAATAVQYGVEFDTARIGVVLESCKRWDSACKQPGSMTPTARSIAAMALCLNYSCKGLIAPIMPMRTKNQLPAGACQTRTILFIPCTMVFLHLQPFILVLRTGYRLDCLERGITLDCIRVAYTCQSEHRSLIRRRSITLGCQPGRFALRIENPVLSLDLCRPSGQATASSSATHANALMCTFAAQWGFHRLSG